MNSITQTRIPALEELQSRPQWVCWKRETRKGKTTKVPYNVYNSKRAESNNPATWASYERAKETCDKYPQDYDGIGYMFNTEITGVDLDHCIDECGIIDDWAQKIIDQLGSYSEISPSGTGVHIFVRGTLPSHKGTRRGVPGQRDPEAAIEMYDSGRYFTVTGNHQQGTPVTIEENQAQLTDLYIEITAPKQKQKKNTSDLGDNELLDKAMNRANFAALWRGDTSDYQGDDSRADAALCAMLAFWTGKNKHRMDAFFRRSGLYRDKWDRPTAGSTYGWITIEKAIDLCTETYSPNGFHQAQTDFPDESEESTLPRIILGGQLRETTKAALDAIKLAESETPTIFVQSGSYRLVRVSQDKEGRPVLATMGVAEIKTAMTKSANYYTTRPAGPDKVKLVPASPPKEVAEQILSLSPADWPFPMIEAIIETPVIRPDGTILDTPGYDPATYLYYMPKAGLEIPTIPKNPTQESVKAAADYIAEFIGDFPYVSPADRANTYGVLITAFIRHLVRHVPLALVNATKQGTGKGLLTDGVAIIATGQTAATLSEIKSEEEWDKRITSLLMMGTTFMSIDNVEGVLHSAILAKTLTSDTHMGRVLGASKMVSVKQKATWLATGNNIMLGGDMPRRCYSINMATQVSNPWARPETDFKHPDLIKDMIKDRGHIIAALLTMVRGWIAAGRPAPEKKLTRLGTFSEWVDTVGGVLAYAGVDGFLENLQEMHEKADVDGKAWALFLETWLTKLGAESYTTKQLLEKLDNDADFADTLPEPLGTLFQEKSKSLSRKLGRALAKKNGTPFGADNLRIVQGEDSHSKVATYKVAGYAGYAGYDSTHARYENFTSSSSTVKEEERNSNSENGANETPQTPQTPQSITPETSTNYPYDVRQVIKNHPATKKSGCLRGHATHSHLPWYNKGEWELVCDQCYGKGLRATNGRECYAD